MRDQEEALLREACAAIAQEEADTLERQMPPALFENAETLYRRHRPTVRLLIARNTKRRKSRLRTVFRTAACAAAAAGILFFALRAPAPEAARVQNELLPVLPAQISAADVPLTLAGTDVNREISLPGWVLFPTYIPEGWALRTEAETAEGLTALFSAGENGPWLQFTQGGSAYLYSVSSVQNASYLRLNGCMVLKLPGAYGTTMVWDQEGLTLTLTGDPAAAEEMEKVVRSVRVCF